MSAALLVTVLLAFTPASASAQAKFTGVGDLPGGSFHSEVRDAAKVGSTILAVGNSNAQTPGCADPCPAGDSAVLWTWDGVNSPTFQALPNLVVNTSATSFVTASAITPDGAYIASRARSSANNGQRQAVRVTTASLPGPAANLAIATLFAPAVGANSIATAISNNGDVLYGQSQNSPARAVRFDAVTSTSLLVPLLPGTSTSSPAARGTSANGSVLVGWTGVFGGGRAFRYVHGSGVTEIPKLDGGTWNAAEAVSADGNLALVVGDSAAYPNGEVYLYDALTGGRTAFGSPNSAWSPNTIAGMTADGSVATVNFGGPTRGFAYFHNSHGWFLLASALGAQGIDVKAQGWTELGILGISPDGTLVFGGGVHNGSAEGWVAEFPAGCLANFNPQPAAPSGTSIVGAWRVNDTESGSPAIVVFMADGTYALIQPAVQATEVNAAPGMERGLYTWDASTGAFTVTTLNDTNGDAGLSDNNGMLDATVFVSGDAFSLTQGGPPIGSRIKATTSPLRDTIVGAWVIGNPAQPDASSVAVFDSDGTYYHAQDGPSADAGSRDGIEAGTFTWDPTSHLLTVGSIAVDTNGESGLSNPDGSIIIAPAIDGLTAQAGDSSGTMLASRIIDPAVVRPVITSPLAANANLGLPFTYTIIASNDAFTFGATGLPAGLSLNGATISGTPTVLGSFDVALTASNTLSTGMATLNITIVTTMATVSGTNVSVTPEVPAGTPPLTMSFSNVTQPGQTTMNVIDPATALSSQAPPAGFSLGDPATYYEISTTATFAGPVTMCFNYAGVDFGGGTPRLFHYTNGAWADITTSVDATTTTVCGVTPSFSPFALFASQTPFIRRVGFYAPVTMTTAFVNTVKGGSTVPLKFNVYVNGVEKTDTAGLQFGLASVNCATSAEDPVDFVTSGDTSLRYDATERQFVQNWKTPKTTGCYIVRMTTTADGKSLSANVKLK